MNRPDVMAWGDPPQEGEYYMEFRLVYEGQLRSGQGGKKSVDQRAIRKVVHQQLRQLWEMTPELKMRSGPHSILEAPPAQVTASQTRKITMAASLPRESLWETLGNEWKRCDYRCVPLVSNRLKLTCGLDVLLLWRDRIVPIGPSGDIDNRLKTLFDALQIPQSCGDVDSPVQKDEYLFCLLENDNLITDVRVTTDRLFTPFDPTPGPGASHPENHVHLVTPSDFDIRHSFAGAVSYEIPAPSWGRAGNAVLKGWAVDGLVRVTSAPPINVIVRVISPVFGPYRTQADIVPGQPYWIADATQPSGTALNPAAFTPSPVGETGNFLRNGLRSPYSINQTDLALRRRFNLAERVKLDVCAEYFNVFNHPMFGLPGSTCNPNTFWGFQGGTARPSFGKVCPGASSTNVDQGGDAFNGQSPLYAVGGPRSAQFTLKVIF